MRKDDIAKRIQQETGISQEEATTLLDWILELFKTTLQKGESITIPNFGTFTVRSKPSRMGGNPRTGEEIMITAHRVVIFRASPLLNSESNPWFVPEGVPTKGLPPLPTHS